MKIKLSYNCSDTLLHLTVIALLGAFVVSVAMAQSGEAPRQNNDGKVDADATMAANSPAIQPKEKDANTFVKRGIAKTDKGDWDGAIADYSRAIELDPKDAKAYCARGTAKLHKGDPDGAIADYNRAIELDSKYVNAYYDRGLTKAAKGDREGAITDYNRAIELDSKHAKAYGVRGDAKADKGDWDGAIADYGRAIELDPKYATAYANRGVAKGEKKDWDGAIGDYSRAIELDPKDANAYAGRGYAKEGKKDWDGAIADYSRAIEVNPKNSYALFNRGKIKASQHRFRDAIADFDGAIELARKDAQTYFWRALAHTGLSDEASGKEEKSRQSIAAVEDFTQSIQLSPTADSFYFRSTEYERLKEYERALKDAKEAVRLDPQNALYLNQRGWMYRRTQSESLALKDFHRALELDPGNKDSTQALEAPSEGARIDDGTKTLVIGGAILGGAYLLNKMLSPESKPQADSTGQQTSAGGKIQCPKCGGQGKIVRMRFDDGWTYYEYRLGEVPPYSPDEGSRMRFWYPKCDRCDGTGVIGK
jgi:tetratricopeptide (TPR) repeat protein